MKKHFLIIATALFLFSCNNGKSVENDTQNVSNNSSNIVFATDFTVPFSGFWINENYYNELLKTRSTRIAQEKSNESFIVITPKSTQPITMIYNVHDGGAEMIIRKTGNNYEFWSATENKKYHDIHIISENKLKIGNISFVKLSNNTEFSNESVQKLIGGILFKGTYTTENNKTITFDADGKITGLSDFQYYAPLIDYFDGGMDIDIVYLGKSTENVQGYAFAFNTDTLFLYDFKCVEILDKLGCCDSITSGELKYKLIKQ